MYRIVSYECVQLTGFFRKRYGTCVIFPWNRAEELATATVSAWKAKYQGHTKAVFLYSLARWNTEQGAQSSSVPVQPAEAAYTNVITILQSSGTGKLCLLYETASDVFTIPINLQFSTREHRSNCCCLDCVLTN